MLQIKIKEGEKNVHKGIGTLGKFSVALKITIGIELIIDDFQGVHDLSVLQ